MLLIRSEWRYGSSLQAGIAWELPLGPATEFKVSSG
jgi:hypothetical protein